MVSENIKQRLTEFLYFYFAEGNSTGFTTNINIELDCGAIIKTKLNFDFEKS